MHIHWYSPLLYLKTHKSEHTPIGTSQSSISQFIDQNTQPFAFPLFYLSANRPEHTAICILQTSISQPIDQNTKPLVFPTPVSHSPSIRTHSNWYSPFHYLLTYRSEHTAIGIPHPSNSQPIDQNTHLWVFCTPLSLIQYTKTHI